MLILFKSVLGTLKIPVHCFGTGDTLKNVICHCISQAEALFSLVVPFSHESEYTKLIMALLH